MYDVIVVGGGISGLYLSYLLTKHTSKKICLLEKTNRLGGLIDTRFFEDKGKQVKYEAGGAVLYDHQKNMMRLVKELGVDTHTLPFDVNGNYLKELREEGRVQPLSKQENKRYIRLLKKVFAFMNKKPENYCRQYTLEQICIQVIGFQDTRFLEYCYGYAGEFRVANSYVAKKNIENEVFHSKNVLFFKKGYEQVIKKLEAQVKDKMSIHLHTEVLSFKHTKKQYIVITTKGRLLCKHLVFMIPQQALTSIHDSFSEQELQLLHTVEPISLCRVFHKYKTNNKWLEDVKYSTVNNALRQIIPANKKHGLLQISYSDWFFADFWGNMNTTQTKHLVKRLTKDTYPGKQIPLLEWSKTHYWKDAIHFWKPKCNEKRIQHQLQELRKGLYIGGESFSLNQGWCEGAIQTSLSIFNKLKKTQNIRGTKRRVNKNKKTRKK